MGRFFGRAVMFVGEVLFGLAFALALAGAVVFAIDIIIHSIAAFVAVGGRIFEVETFANEIFDDRGIYRMLLIGSLAATLSGALASCIIGFPLALAHSPFLNWLEHTLLGRSRSEAIAN